jgi:phosphatidylserine decarboxylase
MKNQLFDLFMPILPKNDLSHWVGKFVHRPLPGLVGRKSVEWFARYYNIDLDEAEYPLEHYRTIGELFTRKLKAGARPVGEGRVVHPADALISQAGPIEKLQLIQAKGKNYTVPELLRCGHYHLDFEGGAFLTYYLCPTDYHRVHAPVDGEIIASCHVPGQMWPVNEWSVNAIPNLFAINERVVVIIQTPRGKVALVMVAATNVGNMTMSFDTQITTKHRTPERHVREHSYNPPIAIKRGDEIGIFHMGSTVVMLYEKGVLTGEDGNVFDVTTARGQRSKMGGVLFA